MKTASNLPILGYASLQSVLGLKQSPSKAGYHQQSAYLTPVVWMTQGDSGLWGTCALFRLIIKEGITFHHSASYAYVFFLQALTTYNKAPH